MKACASCSGGVIFVDDAIERVTNKQASKSYADIVGSDNEANKKPLRKKIFGVFKKTEIKTEAA